MQQYTFLPITKPLVVAQRDFLSLQVGQFRIPNDTMKIERFFDEITLYKPFPNLSH